MFSVAKFILTILILKFVSSEDQASDLNFDKTATQATANTNIPNNSQGIKAKRDGDNASKEKTKLNGPENVNGGSNAKDHNNGPKSVKLRVSTDTHESIELKDLAAPYVHRDVEPESTKLNNADITQEMELKNDPRAAPSDDQGLEPNNVVLNTAAEDIVDKRQTLDAREEVDSDQIPKADDGITSNSEQFNPFLLEGVEPFINPQEKTSLKWPMGIVPYYVNTTIFDLVIINRMTDAMEIIESLSCIMFKRIDKALSFGRGSWLHITNPKNERECVHTTPDDPDLKNEIVVVIGFDCIRPEDMLHTLLHGIGLFDEVTHPHRDQYIRVLWENIQPKYRPLYGIRHSKTPHELAEYDPASIMHFHDRAYSVNGGATIASMIPGLLISPMKTLSQLDVMKLQLAFGHACKKRQVNGLINTCKNALPNDNNADDYNKGSGDTGDGTEHGNGVHSSSVDEESPGSVQYSDDHSAIQSAGDKEEGNSEKLEDDDENDSNEIVRRRTKNRFVRRKWGKKNQG